jgi:hypothetical protein
MIDKYGTVIKLFYPIDKISINGFGMLPCMQSLQRMQVKSWMDYK